MKIVLTIVPFQLERKDKKWTIEREACPPGSEFLVTVYDKDGDNEQFFKDISDADIIINTYIFACYADCILQNRKGECEMNITGA